MARKPLPKGRLLRDIMNVPGYFTHGERRANVLKYKLEQSHLERMEAKPVTLRLALHGCANRPFYHIVATNRLRARDKSSIEQLGTFDPLPNTHNEKLVSLNMDRVKYWLGNGAGASTPVLKLLGLAGIFPVHHRSYHEAKQNRDNLANGSLVRKPLGYTVSSPRRMRQAGLPLYKLPKAELSPPGAEELEGEADLDEIDDYAEETAEQDELVEPMVLTDDEKMSALFDVETISTNSTISDK